MKATFTILAQAPTLIARGVLDNECTLIPALSYPLMNLPPSGPNRSTKILLAHMYDGAGVMLAVPSSWCLSVNIAIGDLPKRNGRQLMIYRLEEFLPAAAEDLIIDFWSGASEALGVAVHTGMVASRVQELEAAEEIYIPINLAGTALLAVQHEALGKDEVPEFSSAGQINEQVPCRVHALLMVEESRIDVVALEDGLPVDWTTWSHQDAAIIQLRALALTHGAPISVVLHGVTDNLGDKLAESSDFRLASCPLTPPDAQNFMSSAAAR